MERFRGARRGVPRIQQLEIERLFHAAPRSALVETRKEARERARVELKALGLEREAVDGVLTSVQRGARAAKVATVTEILNQLAFDTAVDVGAARLILG